MLEDVRVSACLWYRLAGTCGIRGLAGYKHRHHHFKAYGSLAMSRQWAWKSQGIHAIPQTRSCRMKKHRSKNRPKTQPAQPRRLTPPPVRTLTRIHTHLLSVLPVIAIFLGTRVALAEAYRIPSSSMEPTLLVGDWLFVNKLKFGPHIPFTAMSLPGYAES